MNYEQVLVEQRQALRVLKKDAFKMHAMKLDERIAKYSEMKPESEEEKAKLFKELEKAQMLRKALKEVYDERFPKGKTDKK